MADRRGRDQFAVRWGDETEIFWNDAARGLAEEARPRSPLPNRPGGVEFVRVSYGQHMQAQQAQGIILLRLHDSVFQHNLMGASPFLPGLQAATGLQMQAGGRTCVADV